MNKVKKTIAFLLACLMVMSLVSCGNSSTGDDKQGLDMETQTVAGGMSLDKDEEAVESDRVLKVAVSQDSGTLYPYSCTAFGFSGVARTYQDVLFDYKSNGEIEYLLCTGWEEAEGEGQEYHRGRPGRLPGE